MKIKKNKDRGQVAVLGVVLVIAVVIVVVVVNFNLFDLKNGKFRRLKIT